MTPLDQFPEEVPLAAEQETQGLSMMVYQRAGTPEPVAVFHPKDPQEEHLFAPYVQLLPLRISSFFRRIIEFPRRAGAVTRQTLLGVRA